MKIKIVGEVPHFSFFRPENTRTGFFEQAQVEAVIANLPEVLGDVTRFAFLSGWRRGEIIPLRWEQVDRSAREVRLHTSKSGKPRTLPLVGELGRVIERRWAARQFGRGNVTSISPFVFHHHGKPFEDFRVEWRNACKKAKAPDKLFHDLRRTAVRNMIRAGIPQSVAMSITGHETDSMFHRYNITSNEDKRRGLQVQDDYLRKNGRAPESDFENGVSGETTDKNTDKNENGLDRIGPTH